MHHSFLLLTAAPKGVSFRTSSSHTSEVHVSINAERAAASVLVGLLELISAVLWLVWAWSFRFVSIGTIQPTVPRSASPRFATTKPPKTPRCVSTRVSTSLHSFWRHHVRCIKHSRLIANCTSFHLASKCYRIKQLQPTSCGVIFILTMNVLSVCSASNR